MPSYWPGFETEMHGLAQATGVSFGVEHVHANLCNCAQPRSQLKHRLGVC